MLGNKGDDPRAFSEEKREFWFKIQYNDDGKGMVKDDSMISRQADLKKVASQTEMERF